MENRRTFESLKINLPENTDPTILGQFESIEDLLNQNQKKIASGLAQTLAIDLLEKTDIKKQPLYFDSIVEKILYEERHPGYETIEVKTPLFQALYSFGKLLNLNELYDEAVDPLQLALSLSPYSTQTALEYIKALSETKNLKEAKKVIRLALRSAYKAHDIAKIFKELGKIYLEEGKDKEAMLALTLSLKYNPALSTVQFIQDLSETKNLGQLSQFDVKEIVSKEGFPISPDYEVTQELNEYSKRLSEEEFEELRKTMLEI